MKKVCVVLILVLLLFCLLFGCNQRSYDLPLNHRKDQIVKIELYEHTSGDGVLLRSLDSTEIMPFMEKLEDISCYRHFNDPPTEYGYLYIYLYYENGDIDILGTDICDTTSKYEVRRGWYYLDLDEIWELFSQYVPVESLPPKK